jgi:hypothetical protein
MITRSVGSVGRRRDDSREITGQGLALLHSRQV